MYVAKILLFYFISKRLKWVCTTLALAAHYFRGNKTEHQNIWYKRTSTTQ